jgi:hypothetical protein
MVVCSADGPATLLGGAHVARKTSIHLVALNLHLGASCPQFGTGRGVIFQAPGTAELPPYRFDFDTVKVVPGIVNGTWFLIVSGNKPYVTMRVDLSPRVYIRQPEYWGIEVVGCMSGIGLPAVTPYVAVLPLQGVIGTKGIEVIGATRSEKKDISS